MKLLLCTYGVATGTCYLAHTGINSFDEMYVELIGDNTAKHIITIQKVVNISLYFSRSQLILWVLSAGKENQVNW